jgi:hypothetical protein
MTIQSEYAHRIGFWALIVFLLGIVVGGWLANWFIIDRRLSDAIRIGGIVLNQTAYDIKLRP